MPKSDLPETCCRNVGGEAFAPCGKPAAHWYIHWSTAEAEDPDICAYCEEHNYVCGEKTKN